MSGRMIDSCTGKTTHHFSTKESLVLNFFMPGAIRRGFLVVPAPWFGAGAWARRPGVNISVRIARNKRLLYERRWGTL